MAKQYGVGHKIQRLYVHWDITTVCEYTCSYCYAMKQYDGKWMRQGPWTKQLEVLDEMEKSSLPIFLGLLGGEPTSHYRYFELLELIKQKVLKHKDSRLYITTNGSKDINFFKKHKDSDSKQYVLWSWHPEFINKDELELYIDKIKLMLNKGYKNKINIMLHPKKEYWDMTKTFINKCLNIDNLEVHPHFIYKDQHSFIKYSPDFYKQFSFLKQLENKEFVFEDDNKIENLTDIEIFEQKRNQFKGWKCWNNNYEIGLDCKIQQFCFEDPEPISFNYFKNIKEILPRKCPYDYCSCDGLLKIYKES